MKKWIRNLAIGMILNSIKNSKIGQGLINKLKQKNILVGRIGILLFTALGAVKYFNPELPIDDGVEILGIVFSWLALEVGFEKIKYEELVAADPNKPIDIDLGDFAVTLPTLSEFNRMISTDNPDYTGESKDVDNNGEEK